MAVDDHHGLLGKEQSSNDEMAGFSWDAVPMLFLIVPYSSPSVTAVVASRVGGKEQDARPPDSGWSGWWLLSCHWLLFFHQ